MVEAVAAILVMGIALPPLAGMFTEVSAHSVEDAYQSTAVAYADALMEEIVSKAFEDPDLAQGSFGTEEAQRGSFDDIDDYDGLSNSPPLRLDGSVLDTYSGVGRSVRVDNVSPTNPDPSLFEADGSGPLKRIMVTVTWTLEGQASSYSLTTLRSRLTADAPVTIDVPASSGSATNLTRYAFTMEVFNTGSQDLQIASLGVSSDTTSNPFLAAQLNGALAIPYVLINLPTGPIPITIGAAAQHTIPANSSATVDVAFFPPPSGTRNYTLDVMFTNGGSVSIPITIAW